MSMRDDTPFSICRIVGLTSEVGKKRNGAAARMSTKAIQTGNDIRHAVSVDGFPGPMSIKTSNIQIFQHQDEFSVGVGRGTLNDTSFRGTLVYQSQIAEMTMIEGGAARSRGCLAAMDKFVNLRLPKAKAPILVKLTDLNVARAMNRVALGDETVQLAAPLNQQFQTIKKKLGKKDILFIYDPHRVSEDRFQPKLERLGPQRYHAVQKGSYQIYPCALKQYLDAHEVRYIDLVSNKKEVTMNHEIYLDYGKEEACMYAKHAVALGEMDRIYPSVLSQIDPQAYWSAMLWLEAFTKTLQELNVAQDLMDEWKALESGKAKSKEYFEKSMAAFGFDAETLKGPEENWGIKASQDVHLRIATDYAIGAVESVQLSMVEKLPVDFGGNVTLHTLDYYIGTELDNYITGVHKFHEMVRLEGRDTMDDEKTAKFLDKAMKSAGFKRDSKFRIPDPEKVCDNCGKKSKKKLMTCARCEGVSYCDAKCQKEHWKQHRGQCSRVFVQFQKQMNKLGRGGPEIRAGLNKGNGSLPPGPSMLSEASGTGMLGIFWNPDGQSSVTLYENTRISGNAGFDEAQAMSAMGNSNLIPHTQPFYTFSDMHPTQRFLICCGPLPHLETVQECCDEAIRLCDGMVEQLRVPQLGFTALEWATKKGNMEIVQWLCTDVRTKALVKHGCPVGWAGYTGKVEVMRYLVQQGADPARTDPILWSNQPPLFVAASNGQLEASKFYVEECNHNVKMKDQRGNDILTCIKSSPNWRDLPGHVSCHKWAKKLLKN